MLKKIKKKLLLLKVYFRLRRKPNQNNEFEKYDPYANPEYIERN